MPISSQPSHSKPKRSSIPRPSAHPCSETGAVDTMLTPPSQVGRRPSQPLCNTLPMPAESGVISGLGPGDWSHRHGHTPATLLVSSQAHGRASRQLDRAPPRVHPRSASWGADGQQVHEDRPSPPGQQQLYIDEGEEPRQAPRSPPIRL